MQKKKVSALLLTLLLLGMLTLAFNVQPVRASEIDQTVAGSFQGNSTNTIQGGGRVLESSSASSSASFTRHIMCKDHTIHWDGTAIVFEPIDPTTIFRPNDTRAECLTTVSVNNAIEFRWYYRSESSKTWVSIFNWSHSFHSPGEYQYAAWLDIAGYWPGSHYPRAYKVDVYLDGSLSFSEFFEVTNGGLSSPRMCEEVDVDGYPVNARSRFTIGADTKVYHCLRFDKIAYFNDELGCCHNFTTVWIQPDGGTYKSYSSDFADYKDNNVAWDYWEYKYTPDDYITINSSTPVGNWKVEVYLDRYFNNTWMRYGPAATTPFIVGNEPVADWTFMVYLDADNNLEAAGIDIFLKMGTVGSSSQVNIIVQMDRMLGYDSRYGDWADCKRFYVTQGMTPTVADAILSLGEVNMGHPDTLEDFVRWTIDNYPANYCFLVLWDHGAGFVGLCYDFTNAFDSLNLPELDQALSELPAIVDVVFLDASSMSMTEIAYQIKDRANVLVGPEGLSYAPAPYDDFLASLTINPSMLPSTFARDVTADYIGWCNSEGAIQNATMSATDLTRIGILMAAIDDFALKLKERETSYHGRISLARSLAEGYSGPYAGQSGYYIDLYHFAQLTYQRVPDEELRNTADQVMTTLESIIILEADKACPGSHGLSVFFPDAQGKYDSFGDVYEETAFAEGTLWDEFVKNHLSTIVPLLSATVDMDPDTLNLMSQGQWITAYIELPEGYNAEDIDATTILVNETIRPVLDPKYDFVTNSSEYIVDDDGDGILERMVKFSRAEVASWICDDLGIQHGAVTLTITGELVDGTPFDGTVVIRVLFPGDIDGDGYVGSGDFSILAGAYSSSLGDPAYKPEADIDVDGYVGSSDFSILAGNYGKTAT